MNEPFTMFPNDMLEALMCSELSERQIKVTLAIIRRTIGYQRDSATLSLLDISKLTGIAKPHISPILKQLEALHIINLTQGEGRTPQTVAIEQDVSKWLTGSATVPESGTVTKSVTVTESVTVTKSGTKGYQIGNGKVTESVTPTYKRNIKENYKEREGGTIDSESTVDTESPPPPPKGEYGHYKNIRLTAEELESLNNDFSEWNVKRYIEKLDSHIEESGKQYNNHAATLRKWLNNDFVTKDTGKPIDQGTPRESIDVSKYEFVINNF